LNAWIFYFSSLFPFVFRLFRAFAGRLIKQNMADLVNRIASLLKSEALKEIQARFGSVHAAQAPDPVSEAVSKILSQIHELTHNQCAELFSTLGMHARTSPASNVSS
jgi:hypothetical protein